MLWVAVPLDFDKRMVKELRTSCKEVYLGTHVFC